ncbi:hypothetical protein [Nocardia cyriacigeorgica]|uniref:hypothetical protein n=2 Tax=Nocardia cyriacigeorgica TaxID=135487 RepID=UPI0018945EA3|nr:hypothetical protein [Nocardia cyriacigeorgica]MBF6452442.1 hypothetical protein [Nocardia cyriacigeorgica]MBF6481089.1 hypothetical protein [Nocardia cyriacigeorgica]MBF6549611.1 hypothetical protein [Nocardia cyriacigeorgica]
MSKIPTEQPRIKDGENPDNLDHSQINDSFNPLNTTEAFAAANKFTEIENKWTDGVRVFAARIQRSSSAAWDGPAAEAARTALSNYTTRAQDLSPALQAMAARVYGAVDSINTTKRELPEVVEKRPAWNPTSWPYVGSHSASKRDDAEATARTVMGTHYVKPFVDTDREIPVLPKPDDPTQPLVPPVKPPTDDREWEGGGGDSGGGDGAGDGSGGGTGGGGTGDQGGSEGETEETKGTEETGGETTEEQQDPTTTAANTTAPSSTPTSTTSRVTDPSLTSTTPAGVNAAGYSPTGVPGGRTGGSAGTGGAGRAGGAGSGGGSGSGGSGSGSEKPGAGRSIPGGPGGSGAGAGPAAAANAARSAATGRGMMGMPMGGMGAGAGRGGNSDDDEHKTPEYLITAENTDELLGEVPKTVPGGVIGGDIPAAEPTAPQEGEDRR